MQMQPSHRASQSNARGRTSLACNQCRKRKSKCGGEQPCCLVCQTANRRCTYDNNARKRGLQSGYVRSLEIVLGLVFHYFPQSDARVRSILLSQSGKDNLLEGDNAESFSTRWRKSEVARSLGRLLGPSPREDSETVEQDRQPLSLSPAEATDLEAATSSYAENFQELRPTSRTKVIEHTQLSLAFNVSSLRHDLFQVELPNSTTDLVEFYINNTHYWFPIIDRGDLLKSIHTDLPQFPKAGNHDLGMRLSLWAIIAFVLANRSFTDPKFDPNKIQACVRAAIIETDQEYELGHIQALLILALLKIALDQLHAAWILSAQASRMIVDYAERKNVDESRYDRTVRGCVFLDNLLSALLRRTSCWTRKSLTVLNCRLDDNSMDEWQLWTPEAPVSGSNGSVAQKQPLRALSTFSHISELMQKLNTFFETVEDGKTICNFMQELQIWKEGLPRHCQLPDSVPCSQPILHLHLAWHFVICCLGKEIEASDARIFQLVANSTRSIQRLIKQYIDMTGVVRSFSLLICYAMQALQGIEKLNKTVIWAVDAQQSEECHQILQNLQSVAGDRTHLSQTNHDERDFRVDNMASGGSQINSCRNDMDANFQQVSYQPDQELSDHSLGLDVTTSNVMVTNDLTNHGSNVIGRTALDSVQDALDEANKFDGQFLEMSPVLPLRR